MSERWSVGSQDCGPDLIWWKLQCDDEPVGLRSRFDDEGKELLDKIAAALNAAEQAAKERELLAELIDIAKQCREVVEAVSHTVRVIPSSCDIGDVLNAIDCAIDEYAALQMEKE